MKNFTLCLFGALLFTFITVFGALNTYSQRSNPLRDYFMQGNNIQTVFRTDGIYNYDWVSFPSKDAGFIWPVSAPTRLTADFTTGMWIAAKVGPSGN